MKSKRKFSCDYCGKNFVTSAFFKSSHKNSAAHILNRGRYYESLINNFHNKARKKLLKLSKYKNNLTKI